MPSGRRKLTAIDDPLAGGGPAPVPAPKPMSKPRPSETTALYVRLRPQEADRLARAAFELRVHKRELVGALIACHVDGTTDHGRRELQAAVDAYRAIAIATSRR